MLETVKQAVLEANLALPRLGLVKATWGNVSGYDAETGYVVIKPSGVAYDDMQVEDMVVVDLKNRIIEGKLRPSSDTPTHTALYRAYPQVGGIVHTHSTWATIWAQSGRALKILGTTHADTFATAVPCTRFLRPAEVAQAYEEQTGQVIIETLAEKQLVALETPGVLVKGHGPFCWGKTVQSAVLQAVALEEIAKMNFFTEQLSKEPVVLPEWIQTKHYERKHGKDAYYGQ